MAFDDHKNFAYSTVATAPSPPTTGTSLVVQAGHGVRFPAAPFNATIWPAGAQPTVDNAEIVRVTAKATDTFTITRLQEGTSARSVVVGDQIAATVTDKTLTDIEAGLTGQIVFAHAQTSVQESVNETIEREIYGVDLAQNTLTAGRALRAVLWGDVLKNAVGTLTVRVKLGTTTLADSTAITYAGSASRQVLFVVVELFAIAANSQITRTMFHMTDGTVLIQTNAVRENTTSQLWLGEQTSAEDNGAGLRRLSITVQWSAASASLSARALGVKTLVYS